MTRIEQTLNRLQAAAEGGKWVAHATRILLASDPTGGAGRAAAGSGVDPAGGWEEWLGPTTPILEPHEYERAGRWQQGCYTGDADALAEYTAVAAELAAFLPDDFALPTPDGHDPRRDRDVWTFATYRDGGDVRATFQIDSHSDEPFGGSVFGGLDWVISGSRLGAEHDLANLDRLRNAFRMQTGVVPQFLYARLHVDLVTASRQLIDALCRRWSNVYRSPQEMGRSTLLSLNTWLAGKLKPPERIRGQNEERDAWIYSLCCRGVPHKEILSMLNRTYAVDRFGVNPVGGSEYNGLP